jgi:hypothetical protein
VPRLRIPILLKDASVATELRTVEVASLLPGPVSERVAIVDLRDGGVLAEALPVPRDGRPRPDAPRPHRDAATIRWSLFATVLETLKMFESPDCLGRPVSWAFRTPQLLVVPEAGTAPNAFYHRASRSLQFFSYPDETGEPIHLAASPDIVAHETGHAVLDGVAPWLYDAVSPQSLAIHESIADLTALLSAVSSRALAAEVLARTEGDLTRTTVYSGFAFDLRALWGDDVALRELDATRRLEDAPDDDPHALSVVLSSAFYAVLLDAYAARLPRAGRRPKKRFGGAEAPPRGEKERRFLALWFAGTLVKRLVVRGLDYLPPGEVGFLDLARAVLACDRAAHPEDETGLRDNLARRCLERGIGAHAADLETSHDGVSEPLPRADRDALASSDWHAMRYVEARRARLGIPDGVPFEVLPRLRTTKRLHRATGAAARQELILKVTWRERDGRKGWVQRGATVVFDDVTGDVCALVASARLPAARPADAPSPPPFVSSGRTAAELPPAPAGVDATAFRDLWQTFRDRAGG